ncbi:MAG: hypothetical protein HYV45_03365 [Candidatus Moranbacteria bacterium]|nr:hypothetical protein [Candidatus Moranbacteria bacterium]
MPSDAFLSAFWPQFWASVAATFFIATVSIVFAYAIRLRIARIFWRAVTSIKKGVLAEENALRDHLEKK